VPERVNVIGPDRQAMAGLVRDLRVGVVRQTLRHLPDGRWRVQAIGDGAVALRHAGDVRPRRPPAGHPPARRATSARTAVDRMVIDNYASTQRQGRFGSAGVDICFPESKRPYDNDPDGDGYALGNTHYPWSSSIASAGPGSSTPISTR
jgi:hypothetical protein